MTKSLYNHSIDFNEEVQIENLFRLIEKKDGSRKIQAIKNRI